MGKKRHSESRYPRNRRLVVEFDEADRREYVLGMSKRRQERRALGIELLKQQVQREKLENQQERRQILKEKHEERRAKGIAHRRLLEEMVSSDEESGEEDNAKKEESAAQDTVTALTGQGSKVERTEVNDDFSKQMFGSSVVTVTTTKLDPVDSDDEDEDDKKKTKASIPILGEKNHSFESSRAQKELERLLAKRSRNRAMKGTTKTKIGAKSRKSKRKQGKTTAKERRQRAKAS
mmetsp:Transcript_10921/g.20216  ORF Transcript_10921/g.20216 Transcript_10921/m.20216 type:complete len:235 (-) Transcript_10921:150-854(-)